MLPAMTMFLPQEYRTRPCELHVFRGPPRLAAPCRMSELDVARGFGPELLETSRRRVAGTARWEAPYELGFADSSSNRPVSPSIFTPTVPV